MSTRSVDWSLVWTESADPIPGSPDGVAGGAKEYQNNAGAIRSAIDYIDALDLSDLKSDAVAKVIDQMRTVRGELDKIEERVLGVGNALAGYAQSFRDYQNRTMTIWQSAEELKTQRDSAARGAAGLREHVRRVGDSEDTEEAEGEAKALEGQVSAMDGQLRTLRQKFAGVVGERNQAAEELKKSLDAIDQYTPGKDSFWDKVKNWVEGVVSAVFEGVMKLIKGLVNVILDNLRLLVLALIAVFLMLSCSGLLLGVMLFGAAVYSFALGLSLGEYLANPDVGFAMLSAAAGGALIYMAIAGLKQTGRAPFRDCDENAATLTADRELLQCADAAYKYGVDEQSRLPMNYRSLSDAELKKLGIDSGMLVDDASGFKASVYYKDPDGPYVVAFAGSDFDSDRKDLLNDAAGGHGTTKQDMLAINLARAMADKGTDVIYTGHSLGGRQASLAAIATGSPAVTFNPAGPSASAVSLALYARDGNDTVAAAAHLQEASQAVTVYRTEWDVLNTAQEAGEVLAPPAFGDNRIVVHDPTGGDPVDQHSQASLYAAFDDEIKKAPATAGASGGW